MKGVSNLVKSIIDGVTTYYLGRIYELEVEGLVEVERKYYSLGGQRFAVREDTTLNWILSDHLGSTAVSANANGSWRGEIAYTPFGEIRESRGVTLTDYRYTGQRADSYIKLIDMGARRYDPVLGLFISADTIIPNPGNPLDMDRYMYVRNNPLKYIDPSGHLPMCRKYDNVACSSPLDHNISATAYRDIYVFPIGEDTETLVHGGTKGPGTEDYQGPPVEEQMPTWQFNPWSNAVHSTRYPGSLFDSDGNRLESAKWRQSNASHALSLDGSVVVVGYSGGADSALVYSQYNSVSGLILIGPTFSGAVNRSQDSTLNKEEGIKKINDLANNGVKIVIVDDGLYLLTKDMFPSPNIELIDYRGGNHYSDNIGIRALNTDPTLLERAWDFIGR